MNGKIGFLIKGLFDFMVLILYNESSYFNYTLLEA